MVNRQLGKACQMLCGFSALSMFSMPITREGEDVRRTESQAEESLQLGHVAAFQQCLIFWQ